MGKTSYKSTSELIQTLSGNIEKLSNGNLSVSELDELVNTSRDLYELLVVLRFKAFDSGIAAIENKPKSEPIAAIEEKNEPTFDFSEINNTPEETAPSLGFDFTIDEKVEETPKTEAPIEVPEEPILTTTEETVTEKTESVENFDENREEDDNEPNSLNDLFKDAGDLSLRKKFQNSPISDIKGHISIAKKFEYINNMFAGDATVYNDTIEFLNAGESIESARLKMDELSKKYQWDLENKSIVKFIELVERRYQ